VTPMHSYAIGVFFGVLLLGLVGFCSIQPDPGEDEPDETSILREELAAIKDLLDKTTAKYNRLLEDHVLLEDQVARWESGYPVEKASN